MFAKELGQLVEPDGSYYSRTTYLLENLATVKSLCLVADLKKNPDDIIIHFFKSLFSAADEGGESILVNMVDLLVQLVEECNGLPVEAIQMIVDQFTTRGRGVRMAAEVCKQANDHMQRYLCTVRLETYKLTQQYFSDEILRAKEEDSDDSVRIHNLIVEINKHCPSVLLRVIPVLEDELAYDNLETRDTVTTVLGQMFADQGTLLKTAYPNSWKRWLGREKDKEGSIRLLVVEACGKIYPKHPDLAKDMDGTFKTKWTNAVKRNASTKTQGP